MIKDGLFQSTAQEFRFKFDCRTISLIESINKLKRLKDTEIL